MGAHNDEVALQLLGRVEDLAGRVPLLDASVDGDVGGDLVEAGQGVTDYQFGEVPVRGRYDVQGDDPRAAIPGDLTCQVERVPRGVREVRWVQQGLDC
jgi:hypothetical protein